MATPSPQEVTLLLPGMGAKGRMPPWRSSYP